MKKHKLIQARKQKGKTQKEISLALSMDVSNYNRKEMGKLKIRNEEWKKIAKILEVPLNAIYENKELEVIIHESTDSDNGAIILHTIPEFILQTQKKYIKKLESEIQELKSIKK